MPDARVTAERDRERGVALVAREGSDAFEWYEPAYDSADATHRAHGVALDDARQAIVEAARGYARISSKLHADPIVNALAAYDALLSEAGR